MTGYLLVASLLVLMASKPLIAAGKVKMRARENYDWIKLKTAETVWQYQSFSHTINIWYEIPFDYAIGFATGPFAMAYKEASGQANRPQEISDKIKLINHGLEGKYWFAGGLFTRLGLYGQQFNSQASAGKDLGLAGLLGFGYEIDFGGVGLAFEGDKRWSTLQKLGWSFDSNMVAVGVHFYDML